MSGLLDLLDEPLRAATAARLRARSWRKGAVVFNDGDEGDCLHVVVSGCFAVQASTPDGAVVVLRLVHPGQFFGELALVNPEQPRIGRVTALETGETAAL